MLDMLKPTVGFGGNFTVVSEVKNFKLRYAFG